MVSKLMNSSEGQYRIGAVAKMTGIAVATLRVWQSRHQVVNPTISQGGQRLYSEQEVKKLALIKGLNQAGHSIGLIAGLSLEQLQELAFKHQQLGASPHHLTSPQSKEVAVSQEVWSGAQVRTLCLVGGGLLARMNSLRYSIGLAQINLELQHESGLTQLLESLQHDNPTPRVVPHAYLIKLNSTSSENLKQLQALRALLPNARIGVLYHYALARELEDMREMNIEFKRETLPNDEMLAWVKELLVTTSEPQTASLSNYAVKERIFSNDALSYFAQIDNPLLCECPKHLAQIIEQIASFEQYSFHCLSASPQDKALHASLHQVSSICRSMFEQSLLQVVKHEGLELPEVDIS